jgi:hypothetical protein
MRGMFFLAQSRADLCSEIADKVGFCLVPRRMVVFDSVVPKAFGMEKVSKH